MNIWSVYYIYNVENSVCSENAVFRQTFLILSVFGFVVSSVKWKEMTSGLRLSHRETRVTHWAAHAHARAHTCTHERTHIRLCRHNDK